MTIPRTTDTHVVRAIDTIEDFAHTVQLHTYDDYPGPEIVVTFGGQSTVGDLHDAREAREVAFGLLAAANDLDRINGVFQIPALEQQHDGDKATWMEAKFAGKVGDFYWITPQSPDIEGGGIAVDANRDDRSPEAVRQMIVELSMTLSALEALTA